MSELGMDSRGDIRTAYEFKDIFDDIGVSCRPYRCPFCEVPYEDKCIVTECVKAPHFKLPNGSTHRGDCNGEPDSTSPTERAKQPARVVIGEVEVPEALVARRPPRRVGPAADGGVDTTPSDAEVRRRRRLLAGDRTIAGKFTSSLLRAIVAAHKRLMKVAFEKATAARHAKGTPEYKETFKAVLESYPLELFGQKLTYRSAFLTSKLSPASKPRIYGGIGTPATDGFSVLITDADTWPKEYKKPERLPFIASLEVVLPVDAAAPHVKAIEELTAFAGIGQKVRWWTYGLPQLDGKDRWVLPVSSLDHFYWEVVR